MKITHHSFDGTEYTIQRPSEPGEDALVTVTEGNHTLTLTSQCERCCGWYRDALWNLRGVHGMSDWVVERMAYVFWLAGRRLTSESTRS